MSARLGFDLLSSKWVRKLCINGKDGSKLQKFNDFCSAALPWGAVLWALQLSTCNIRNYLLWSNWRVLVSFKQSANTVKFLHSLALVRLQTPKQCLLNNELYINLIWFWTLLMEDTSHVCVHNPVLSSLSYRLPFWRRLCTSLLYCICSQ